MRTLPRRNLWDGVYVKGPTPRRRPVYGLLLCSHSEVQKYTRVDRRTGPGWMATNYMGTVCSTCGTIISEKKA